MTAFLNATLRSLVVTIKTIGNHSETSRRENAEACERLNQHCVGCHTPVHF